MMKTHLTPSSIRDHKLSHRDNETSIPKTNLTKPRSLPPKLPPPPPILLSSQPSSRPMFKFFQAHLPRSVMVLGAPVEPRDGKMAMTKLQWHRSSSLFKATSSAPPKAPEELAIGRCAMLSPSTTMTSMPKEANLKASVCSRPSSPTLHARITDRLLPSLGKVSKLNTLEYTQSSQFYPLFEIPKFGESSLSNYKKRNFLISNRSYTRTAMGKPPAPHCTPPYPVPSTFHAFLHASPSSCFNTVHLAHSLPPLSKIQINNRAAGIEEVATWLGELQIC